MLNFSIYNTCKSDGEGAGYIVPLRDVDVDVDDRGEGQSINYVIADGG